MKISMAQILLPLIILLFIIMLMGCGTYVPKKVASHVLAVTFSGDTILVPMDRSRPKMYRNYYPIYRSNYYYNDYYPFQYQWRYNDYRGSNSTNNNNGNNNNNNSKSVLNPTNIIKRPSGEVLLKGKKK